MRISDAHCDVRFDQIVTADGDRKCGIALHKTVNCAKVLVLGKVGDDPATGDNPSSAGPALGESRSDVCFDQGLQSRTGIARNGRGNPRLDSKLVEDLPSQGDGLIAVSVGGVRYEELLLLVQQPA